ncbi:hypothetical protein FIBSPDRAFT_931221 [Athelia psychrophila]|uniref:Uncharacterized protein n=1 Tax=Athelia psychrophila TaxID=1759441 RepID=A0A166KSR0_9AGAM|nr:hypothetical protein FIBSPDRAFT_931221 [Fibularhizoctonia sp. CBS 109695]
MSGTYSEKLGDTQRELGSYFDKSATVVRSNFEWFETAYIRPLITFSLDAFDTHPWVTTFFAIFAALSLLPVVSFLGMTVFVIAFVSFLFFVLAVVTITVFVVLFGILLLTTLTVLLIVSFFLTPIVLSTYIITRLVLHLRREGSMGFSTWLAETKAQLLGRPGQLKENAEGSESSTSSGVLVDGDKDVKVEGK